MRRAVVLVLLAIALAPAVSAAEPCARQDGDHVCWSGSTDADVAQSTALGRLRVVTYTDAREGGDDVDYTASRDGATVTFDGLAMDAQHVRYSGRSDGTSVRFEEIRVSAAERPVAVGLRRTSAGPVEVCDVYAGGRSVEAPCSPLFP